MKKENLTGLWMQGLLMAATIATALPMADIVMAGDLASVQTGAKPQFNAILLIIQYVAYFLGTLLCIGGVMKLKHHAENPGSNPLNHGLGRLGAGVGLIALPYLAGTLVTSSSLNGANTNFVAVGNVN